MNMHGTPHKAHSLLFYLCVSIFFVSAGCKTRKQDGSLSSTPEQITDSSADGDGLFPIKGAIDFRNVPSSSPTCIEIECKDNHGLTWGQSLANSMDVSQFRTLLVHLRCKMKEPAEVLVSAPNC